MDSFKYKVNCWNMLGSAILLTLSLHSQARHVSAFSTFSSVIAARSKQIAKRSPIMPATTNDGTPIQTFEEDDKDSLSSRRSMLTKIFTAAAGAMTATMASSSDICNAATPRSSIDPETAYTNLRNAREELVFAGRTYFPKQDWEGLREYLSNEDSNINNYDANASALLTSKRLDTESKQAIGTIRRYGVGADVIIMYGGLKAELSEENERFNAAEIQKCYVKTLDSLEEVIAIVRSNPGFGKIN